MDRIDTLELIRAVERWANHHPQKNKPMLRIVGKKHRYSPMEIVAEIRANSPTGKLLVRVLANIAQKRSPAEIVKRFDRMVEQMTAKEKAGTASSATG